MPIPTEIAADFLKVAAKTPFAISMEEAAVRAGGHFVDEYLDFSHTDPLHPIHSQLDDSIAGDKLLNEVQDYLHRSGITSGSPTPLQMTEALPNISEAHRKIAVTLSRLDNLVGGEDKDDPSALAKLLATNPITFAPEGGATKKWNDLSGWKSGYIMDDAGKIRHLMARPGTEDNERELLGYQVHQILPFTTKFPVTVFRPQDNMLVQERIGRSIGQLSARLDRHFYGIPQNVDAFSENLSVDKFLEGNKAVENQFAQAIAERGIMGASDDHEGTYALTLSNGRISVANLNMDYAFQGDTSPEVPYFRAFQGRSIDHSTLSKIATTVDILSDSSTRSGLEEAGLPDRAVDLMVGRAKWYLDKERFPTWKDF